MSYIIIQCGSQARGDTNQHSDSDYVCIHEDTFNFKKLIKSQFPQISFLSIETIDRMKKKGALFLTHIDVDGKYIEGNKNLLYSIKGFKPEKKSLKHSIIETQQFLSEMKWLPNSETGKYWYLDILFVALRNILYCSNGLNSIYKFGFTDALIAFGLNNIEIDNMLEIRQGKYDFRLGSKGTKQLNIVKLEKFCFLASKISCIKLECTLGGKTNWLKQWQFNYWDERLIERAIINNEIENDGFREKLQDHNYFKRELTNLVKERIITK